jgi:bifunctional N-acetylglucosamine-1-phosphate-uridyltransferase/glucosamine-1-phosphate-acetyltransferase GlmU-like protein
VPARAFFCPVDGKRASLSPTAIGADADTGADASFTAPFTVVDASGTVPPPGASAIAFA